jgi:hypothetical protein
MKQSSLKKWFTIDRVETKVEIACQSPARHEGTGQRISSGTVELTNKDKEFNKAKTAWGGIGIASYNVETLGNNRIQTICEAMEEKGVKIIKGVKGRGKKNRRRTNGYYEETKGIRADAVSDSCDLEFCSMQTQVIACRSLSDSCDLGDC